MLKPAVKGIEKKIFRCLADAEEEVGRFQKLPGLKLFEYSSEIEKVVKEKWPAGSGEFVPPAEGSQHGISDLFEK